MIGRLDQRKWSVLRAVIRDYILTALPVGSEKIANRYSLNTSPATVRKIMSCLEDLGFLEQPHSSSGRIPTDLGLRYYVDALMDPKPLRRDVKDFILGRYRDGSRSVNGIMQETSRILSRVSRYAGIVSAPRLSQAVLEQIDIVRLDYSRILVVFMSHTGVIYNRVMEEMEGVAQEDLNQALEALNRRVKGKTLTEVMGQLREQIETERIQFGWFLERLFNMSAWDRSPERTEVFIDGQSNILDYPEFSEDVRKIKSLLRTFEEKEMLLRVLDKAMEEDGIRVYIGNETQLDEMAECSLIFSHYCRGGIPVGTLGVIGPKRMDYSRVIPLVEFAAKAVGDKLDQMEA